MKDDLKRVRRIGREGDLTPEELRGFGDYLEECKRHGDYGSLPNGDHTDQELQEKLD
jgi:hypothetical protein